MLPGDSFPWAKATLKPRDKSEMVGFQSSVEQIRGFQGLKETSLNP